MPAPVIDHLIEKQDASELVRDAIAYILLTEEASQRAQALGPMLDPEQWRLQIFTERAHPWEDWAQAPDPDTAPARCAPMVNVCLGESSFDAAAGNYERQQGTATFYVDVYGYSISRDNPAGGHKAGDKEAAFECQRAVRLVRNILMAGTYYCLGLPGVVGGRWVRSINYFQPMIEQRAVVNVVGARLAFDVVLLETSPQVAGEVLDVVSFTMKRAETGQVFLTADFDVSEP